MNELRNRFRLCLLRFFNSSISLTWMLYQFAWNVQRMVSRFTINLWQMSIKFLLGHYLFTIVLLSVCYYLINNVIQFQYAISLLSVVYQLGIHLLSFHLHVMIDVPSTVYAIAINLRDMQAQAMRGKPTTLENNDKSWTI